MPKFVECVITMAFMVENGGRARVTLHRVLNIQQNEMKKTSNIPIISKKVTKVRFIVAKKLTTQKEKKFLSFLLKT